MALQHGQTAAQPAKPGGFASALAAFPAGRRAKWLIFVAWIVIVAAVSPLAAKLGDAEKNDAAAWLPGNAESLKATNLQDRFPNGETSPAVVVYHRDGGLTDADRAKIETDRQAIAATYPQTPPGPAVPSQDGQAVLSPSPSSTPARRSRRRTSATTSRPSATSSATAAADSRSRSPVRPASRPI